MASKSQTKYMTAVALVIGVGTIMERHYAGMPGRSEIKTMINDLKDIGNQALLLAHGDLSRKQLDDIWDKIKDMDAEDVPSMQVYVSMLIGIVSDLVVEIPVTSQKNVALKGILMQLETIYAYFICRTRQEKFDVEGTRLMVAFSENFKTEAA